MKRKRNGRSVQRFGLVVGFTLFCVGAAVVLPVWPQWEWLRPHAVALFGLAASVIGAFIVGRSLRDWPLSPTTPKTDEGEGDPDGGRSIP